MNAATAALQLRSALVNEGYACEVLARKDLTPDEHAEALAHWANCVDSLRHASRAVLGYPPTP